MTRVQICTTIDPRIRATLYRMADDDSRTLSGEIEWLVREEQRRRQPVDREAEPCSPTS